MELGHQHLVHGLPNPDPLLAKLRVLLCEKKNHVRLFHINAQLMPPLVAGNRSI
jgi:hypothetical protein